ncbi:MAG: flagellar biosynthesis protein FlhA, partial [Opitutaceae bacterium]|nr:flagellar biosynthesis protein FlhA [Opitutaceae bacterium]
MNPLLSRFQSAILRGTRYTDILLAMLIVAVIGLMIIRIPPWALDVLLALNLSLSAVLLMMSLYIPGILAFSTFPTLLLFTTLFRLALNITTTRLILINAHAGEIIYTFGNFTVGGNFIVGAVIFLIITIVQFIVITKGSERVAEVGARFTLDAMPGKQMAIDADLRAGLIDHDAAKTRRGNLERENQLYGAMDGAMKFVKGDAIASLIITAINIVAGITIGVLQKGFPIEKAVKTYTILTIGDGLVSQIPALLISITAGIIVTRVGGGGENQPLGGEIGGQMLAQPKALLIGAGLCVVMALIPGFPKPVFLVLGALVGSIGYTVHRALMSAPASEKGSIPALAPAVARTAPRKQSGAGGGGA